MTRLQLAKWLAWNVDQANATVWDYLSEPARARYLILADALAKELGIDLIPECPYTHSHTRRWCGNPDCRES